MERERQRDRRRIVVIGPCASGKTTLTRHLQERGYDARACGQEHSEIRDLWQHADPDVLVGLKIALQTLRDRRSATWSARLYERQLERLQSGYDHADLIIDADRHGPDAVLKQVLTWLGSSGP